MSSLPVQSISKSDAAALINEQIRKGWRAVTQIHELDQGSELSERRYADWDQENRELLKEIFDGVNLANEYQSIASNIRVEGEYTNLNRVTQHESRVQEKISWLKELLVRIQSFAERTGVPAEEKVVGLDVVHLLCSRFHAVVRQLRDRYDGRPAFEIQDEYDVQDLLHALLRIHFTDIRPEEWTPSYAGGASRLDFLLKQERIVVEVKKTRPTLKARQLGEQLIVDIARYKNHQDCDTLYCFVYDPDGHIANPAGLENDLCSTKDRFTVQVYIGPRH